MDLHSLDAHRHTIDTRSGPISYLDAGTSLAEPDRTALFVHGVATNGNLWRHTIGELRADHRCVALDLPLHGRSPIASDQDVTLSGLSRVIVDLCDALGLDRVDLVANDTGGALAQLHAVAHPERLSSLTLTNCDTQQNLPPEAFAPTVELAKAGLLAPSAPALFEDLAATRDAVLGSSFEHPEAIGLDVVRDYLEPILGTPEHARHFERILAAMDVAELEAIEPALRELEVPTLLVWGTDDIMFPLADAAWLLATIPGATEIVEIEGGHLFWPEERGAELGGHLRKHWAA
jgi:pimeloyl-ACP methyl ester carboxylesterase